MNMILEEVTYIYKLVALEHWVFSDSIESELMHYQLFNSMIEKLDGEKAANITLIWCWR